MPFSLKREGELVYWCIPAFAEAGVTAAFSTRLGGVSRGPYATLNMGFHVGDDPAAVRENRRRFFRVLGFQPEDLVEAEQVHGSRVQVIGKAQRGTEIPATDALVTNIPGLLLGEFFADCVPLYFLDPRSRAVALAHAGWRGTVANIAAGTLEALSNAFGSRPEDCLVAIGPSIGPCCYEVDEHVVGPLRESFPGWQEAVTPSGSGKWFLDLWEVNARQLREKGVKNEHILAGKICTACRPGQFFSYRAHGVTGRMAAAIAIQERRPHGQA